jgi:hypothetical protein
VIIVPLPQLAWLATIEHQSIINLLHRFTYNVRNLVIFHRIQNNPLHLSNPLLVLRTILRIGRNCSFALDYAPDIPSPP